MRKRSKYKPKGVRIDVMSWLKSGFKPVSEVSEIMNVRIKNHEAILSIRMGSGTTEDVDTLIMAFNVTESLARMKIGNEFNQEIRIAQDAVMAMCKRAAEHGKFIFKGDEMNAVNLAMEIHDAQLDVCTVQDMERAYDHVLKELRAKRVRVLPKPAALATA